MRSSTRSASVPRSSSPSPTTGQPSLAWLTRSGPRPPHAARRRPGARCPRSCSRGLRRCRRPTGVLALARRPAGRAPLLGLTAEAAAGPPGESQRSRQYRRRRAGRGRRRCRRRADHRPSRSMAPGGPARLGRPAFRPAGRAAAAFCRATPRPLVALHPYGPASGRGRDPDRRRAGLRHRARRAQPGPARPRRPARRHPDAPGVSSLNLATAVAVALYAWRLGRPAMRCGHQRSRLRYCIAAHPGVFCGVARSRRRLRRAAIAALAGEHHGPSAHRHLRHAGCAAPCDARPVWPATGAAALEDVCVVSRHLRGAVRRRRLRRPDQDDDFWLGLVGEPAVRRTPRARRRHRPPALPATRHGLPFRALAAGAIGLHGAHQRRRPRPPARGDGPARATIQLRSRRWWRRGPARPDRAERSNRRSGRNRASSFQ